MTKRIYNNCGRIHLGPCCINGGTNDGPQCMHCGEDITMEQREQINKTWNRVRALLAPFKEKHDGRRN